MGFVVMNAFDVSFHYVANQIGPRLDQCLAGGQAGVLILEAEHLQIGHEGKAHILCFERKRRRQHRALDFAGFQRRNHGRHVAGLQDGNVLAGRKPVSLQRITERKVGGGTEPRDRHGLPFQLVRLLDALVDVKFKCQRVDHSRNHHDIRASQPALQHPGAGHLREGDLFGNQALHRGAAAFDENELRIDAIFTEQAALVGNP